MYNLTEAVFPKFITSPSRSCSLTSYRKTIAKHFDTFQRISVVNLPNNRKRRIAKQCSAVAESCIDITFYLEKKKKTKIVSIVPTTNV